MQKKLMQYSDKIMYISLGMLMAFTLSYITPLSPLTVFITLVAVAVVFVLLLAYEKDLANIRLAFLGASAVSLTLAFVTFSSLTHLGLYSVTLDQIVGIFRSILLTSYFSVLERLTKFFEDQRHKRQEMPKV
jgi:hypothetical protein